MWYDISITANCYIQQEANKMEQKKIDRINELYKKQKEYGLTEEEKNEQQILRKEYIGLFRKNLKATLSTIKVQDENGEIRALKSGKDKN